MTGPVKPDGVLTELLPSRNCVHKPLLAFFGETHSRLAGGFVFFLCRLMFPDEVSFLSPSRVFVADTTGTCLALDLETAQTSLDSSCIEYLRNDGKDHVRGTFGCISGWGSGRRAQRGWCWSFWSVFLALSNYMFNVASSGDFSSFARLKVV